MSGTAQDVIDVAKSFLGTSDGAQFFALFGEPDRGAWCVAYVRAVMKLAGAGFDWHTWYAWDYGDTPNPIAPKDFKMADGVSFDWPDDEGRRDSKGNHVGIFHRFETRDGVRGFWSYEGNTSGGIVDYKWRPLSCAICGIRPSLTEPKDEWRYEDGRWWYRHADGSYTTNGWEQIDGKWYYFDREGWMLASTVVEDKGSFYALGKSGAMLTDVRTHTAHDGRYGALEL